MKTLREFVKDALIGDVDPDVTTDSVIEDAILPWLKTYIVDRDLYWDNLADQCGPDMAMVAMVRHNQKQERQRLDALVAAIEGE